MIEISSKVGPKGQVVIPKVLRDAFKIAPGSEVIFSVDGEKLVLRKARKDAVSLFESLARSRKRALRLHPHEAYEKEIEERLG
ncbi:MAG: AbrB/MazE/SpoVT family DNA-binding domain-containing protein [Thermoplasmata archaeon]